MTDIFVGFSEVGPQLWVPLVEHWRGQTLVRVRCREAHAWADGDARHDRNSDGLRMVHNTRSPSTSAVVQRLASISCSGGSDKTTDAKLLHIPGVWQIALVSVVCL